VISKTFIVIDDDTDDTDLISTAAAEIDPGVNCIVFNASEQAIDYLRQDSTCAPDFIILDLNMPRIGGRECLTILRKLARYKNVPIIINSTTIVPKDRTELKTLGASYIFAKTYRFEKLVEILRYMLADDWVKIH
jgi:DNA-binding response OmpR family regulator